MHINGERGNKKRLNFDGTFTICFGNMKGWLSYLIPWEVFGVYSDIVIFQRGLK